VVSMLLKDRRAEPDAEGSAVLRWAADNEHVKVVWKLLLDVRADHKALGSCALSLASTNKLVVWKLLLDGRADPSA
jgi:hypothetical protein